MKILFYKFLSFIGLNPLMPTSPVTDSLKDWGIPKLHGMGIINRFTNIQPSTFLEMLLSFAMHPPKDVRKNEQIRSSTFIAYLALYNIKGEEPPAGFYVNPDTFMQVSPPDIGITDGTLNVVHCLVALYSGDIKEYNRLRTSYFPEISVDIKLPPINWYCVNNTYHILNTVYGAWIRTIIKLKAQERG